MVYVRLVKAGGSPSSPAMTKLLEDVLRSAARRNGLEDAVAAIGGSWPPGGESPERAIERHAAARSREVSRERTADDLIGRLADVDPSRSRGCAAAVQALDPAAATALPGPGESASSARWTLDADSSAAFDVALRRADGSKGPVRHGAAIAFASPAGPAGPDGRREWDVMALGRDGRSLHLREAGRYVGRSRTPPPCSIRADVAIEGVTASWDRADLPAIACGNYRITLSATASTDDPERCLRDSVLERCGIEPRPREPDDAPPTRLLAGRAEIAAALAGPEPGTGARGATGAALAAHAEAVVAVRLIDRERSPGRPREAVAQHGRPALAAIAATMRAGTATAAITLDASVIGAIHARDPEGRRLLALALAETRARETARRTAARKRPARDAGRG